MLAQLYLNACVIGTRMAPPLQSLRLGHGEAAVGCLIVLVREWAVTGRRVAIRSEGNVAADPAAGQLKAGACEGRLLRPTSRCWRPTSGDVRGKGLSDMLRQSLAPPPWRRRTVQ